MRLVTGLLTIVACSLLGSPAFAQRMQAGLTEQLAQADNNHDGLVSRDEFTQAGTRQFDRLDRNRDGVIDQAEIQQASQRLQAKSDE